MATVDIPFTKGQHEEADSKLLPQGLFVSLTDCRYRKDGKLGVRNGYAIGSSVLQPVAAGDYAPSHSIYVYGRVDGNNPGRWYDHRPDNVYTSVSTTSTVPTVGVPRRVPLLRNSAFSICASDAAHLNGFIHVLYSDVDPATGASAGVYVRAFEALSGRVLLEQVVDSSGTNPKICVVGSTLMMFYASGNNIRLLSATWNGSAYTTVASTIVVAAATGRAFSFDIAPNSGTSCLLVYENAATAVRVGTVSTAGAFTPIYIQTTGNPARPSITLQPNGNIAMAWAEGATFVAGNLRYRVDTTAGGIVTAATTIDSSGQVAGFPVVGPCASTSTFAVSWVDFEPSGGSIEWRVSRSGGALRRNGFQSVPVSKPFLGPNGSTLMWVTDSSYQGLIGAADGAFPSYFLVDVDSAAVSTYPSAIIEASACAGEALSGANYISSPARTFFDPRRFSIAPASVLPVPSATAVATVLPVLGPGRYDADLVRLDTAPLADRLLPAQINAQLIFSGARQVQFDGGIVHDSPFAQFPQFLTAQVSHGGGALSAGTYEYTVIYEWYDAGGRRCRSAPATPISVVTVANDQVLLSFVAPCSLNFALTSATTVRVVVRVYRTQVGESVFQLINDTFGVALTTQAVCSYQDGASDASIADNEILYTQGGDGGESSTLENDQPPPCRFLWAGQDRLIAGGLEIAEEVQFSKLRGPGQPMQWHNGSDYKLRIGAENTGVAEMDGTYFLFGRDNIWTSTGAGPFDDGSGSPFGSPVKLPTDFGCVSQRSMLLTGLGLIFQSAVGFAIIPRGGNAPDRTIGDAVRDTVAAFSLCTASAYNKATGTAYWAMVDAATGTVGRLLVFDTRMREWYVDVVNGGRAIKTLNIYNDRLVIDGQMIETPGAYVDDDGVLSPSNVVLTWETGDIRLFGQNGWGRYRKVQLLGELRDVTNTFNLTLAVSYDSGQTYGENAAWPRLNLGTAVGDAINGAEHMFVIQRTGAVRLKGSIATTVPTEGVIFNGLSLEGVAAPGMKRQPNSMRAP